MNGSNGQENWWTRDAKERRAIIAAEKNSTLVHIEESLYEAALDYVGESASVSPTILGDTTDAQEIRSQGHGQ